MEEEKDRDGDGSAGGRVEVGSRNKKRMLVVMKDMRVKI